MNPRLAGAALAAAVALGTVTAGAAVAPALASSTEEPTASAPAEEGATAPDDETVAERLAERGRGDQGRAGRPVVPVDLVPVVVAALADAHAAGPAHTWVLELASDEPVVVAGDEARLHQVVVNLLANARVHTPPGTRVVLRLDVDGTDAVVSVADDGPGVPEQLRGQVFERFSRADGSRSRAAGSTGLGLSIVAAVVEAHGGTVACPSVPTGAEFVVRLPLAPAGLDRPANT